jgi:hypothetical protein
VKENHDPAANLNAATVAFGHVGFRGRTGNLLLNQVLPLMTPSRLGGDPVLGLAAPIEPV